jgi:hypothetical protein
VSGQLKPHLETDEVACKWIATFSKAQCHNNLLLDENENEEQIKEKGDAITCKMSKFEGM